MSFTFEKIHEAGVERHPHTWFDANRLAVSAANAAAYGAGYTRSPGETLPRFIDDYFGVNISAQLRAKNLFVHSWNLEGMTREEIAGRLEAKGF